MYTKLQRRRASQIMLLTQWLRRHPDASELVGVRQWLMDRPDAPGMSERTMAGLRGRYAIETCFACEKPALYYCGLQGACNAHRDQMPRNQRRIAIQQQLSAAIAEKLDAIGGGPRLKMANTPNDTRGKFSGLQWARRFAPNGPRTTKKTR